MDVRIQLVYRVGSRCIPVADSNAPELLRFVKKQVLKESFMLAQRAKGIDQVLGALYELDQAKLEGVLNILLPEHPDFTVPPEGYTMDDIDRLRGQYTQERESE